VQAARQGIAPVLGAGVVVDAVEGSYAQEQISPSEVQLSTVQVSLSSQPTSSTMQTP